jgi:hypothetical protein
VQRRCTHDKVLMRVEFAVALVLCVPLAAQGQGFYEGVRRGFESTESPNYLDMYAKERERLLQEAPSRG